MLYLEDYLEMIENLPMEMRDRLTEIRENDLEVQNSLDSLEETVKTYFKKCQSSSLKDVQKTENFMKIKQAYEKALEETDEKVQIANQIYEIVERHLRKLDHELSKFKMELEADNAGITEVLEKRSLEDEVMLRSTSRGEKRKAIHLSNMTNSLNKRPALDTTTHSLTTTDAGNKDVSMLKRAASASNSPAVQMFASTQINTPTAVSLAGGTNAAIQAAASQAIAATQQVHSGRRTPNIKVSVSNNTELNNDLALARDAAFTASQFTPEATPSRSQRNKKQSAKAAALRQQQQEQQQHKQQAAAAAAVESTVSTSNETAERTSIDANGQVVTWTYDPNEPRYCLCNDVSYGDMVGCDNPDCPMEWFHYPCVGLTQAPKGKWFCPQCTTTMKRRGRR